MKIVEIEWTDHSVQHNWTEKLAKPENIRQVGYLAKETDDYYVLLDSKATAEDERPCYGCNTCILKKLVVTYREVGEVEDF